LTRSRSHNQTAQPVQQPPQQQQQNLNLNVKQDQGRVIRLHNLFSNHLNNNNNLNLNVKQCRGQGHVITKRNLINHQLSQGRGDGRVMFFQVPGVPPAYANQQGPQPSGTPPPPAAPDQPRYTADTTWGYNKLFRKRQGPEPTVPPPPPPPPSKHKPKTAVIKKAKQTTQQSKKA
ncbi:MAG: hypothetical protein ACKPKO_57375, partial [Candidatus Fonsibacter sp.]